MMRSSPYGFTILAFLLTKASLKLIIFFMHGPFRTSLIYSLTVNDDNMRLKSSGAWTGVCIRGAWMIASVGVCVSQSEWDLPTQQHV